jgi:formylmethanofuran dehydrogenase subunit B
LSRYKGRGFHYREWVMARAWIGGKPAALETALGEAAELLAASRCALITGLGTDIAGARAAIGLAERIGAVVDHMNADVLLRDLAVLREAGMMVTTPNEARLRADTLLLVGPTLEQDAPELAEWLGLEPGTASALPPPRAGESPPGTDRNAIRSAGGEGKAASTEQAACPSPQRKVVRLCAGRAGTPVRDETRIGSGPDQLPSVLAVLRARIAGRPAGKTGIASKSIADLARLLKAAKFGVAVWSARDLDPLAIEMLCGIVADLNAHTRFTGFSIAPADNALGVLQACGWMTGFPMRTGLGRGYPEHDPWRFDGARMVAARETDCVLWVSAFRTRAPPWRNGPPTIALVAGDAVLDGPPAVQIEVGQPGIDYDSVAHFAPLGTLVAREATRRSEAMSIADAVGRITAALETAR